MAADDVACDQAGFTDKHLVGTGGSVNCTGDCGNCTAQNPTCTAISVDLFGDTTCGGTKVITLPGGTCTPTGTAANSGIGSMIYHATASATDVAERTPTPAPSLTTPRTVCCAP
jgi:hypothetical protein